MGIEEYKTTVMCARHSTTVLLYTLSHDYWLLEYGYVRESSSSLIVFIYMTLVLAGLECEVTLAKWQQQ